MTTEFKRMQIRRGTSAQWASSNPVGLAGELGYDSDTRMFKIFDGSTAWNSLPWAAAPILTPTAVKTSAYTAVVGELVRADPTSGTFSVTLPSAPSDKSLIGVAKVDSGSNIVTIARGGTDVFEKTGGAASMTLPGTNAANAFTAVLLQYVAASGVWLPISGWKTPAAGGGGGGIITGRGTFASRPTGTNVGDLYFPTDIGNEYRWNGSSWDMIRGGTLTIFTPPPTSGWTALNSGSVSTGLDSRVVTLASSAGDNWKGETRTLSPASNYTATFYFDWTIPGVNYAGAGIILRNSGAGGLVTFGTQFDSGVGNWNLRSTKWTSPTVFSAVYISQAVTLLTNGIPNWLRIRDDATTRFLEYSYNGVDWVLHQSVGRTDFITPDQIGWGVNSNNAGGTYTATTRLRHLSGVS